MFIEVPSFQIYKLYLFILVLQKSDFLSINLFPNSKTCRKWAALTTCMNTNNHLFNPLQTYMYRGRWDAFVIQIDPSWVNFTKTQGELFSDSSFVLKKTILSNNINVTCKCFIRLWSRPIWTTSDNCKNIQLFWNIFDAYSHCISKQYFTT